jgi:toxin ParE1/3/4
MMRLVYSERSLEDIDSLLDYIARDKPGSAATFGEGLIATCELIAKNPGVGERRDDIAPNLKRFNYRGYQIFFRVSEDSVRIQRVLHGAREAGRVAFDEE